MPKRAFLGDADSRLPWRKREPYRLWFEYLKLALRYPDISVDMTIYDAWGDFANSPFDEWWEEHWRPLFAVASLATVISSAEAAEDAIKDPSCVVLRVDLSETKARRMKDVEQALTAASPKMASRKRLQRKPRFEISAKSKINYKTLRGMLRFLEFFEAERWNLEDASLAYLEWAKSWNEKVKTQQSQRPLVYVPTFLPSFTEAIRDKRQAAAAKQRFASKHTNYDNLRHDARRFMRKGERVLRNVAGGSFPGQF